MIATLRAFLNDESGTAIVEYSLVLALVSMVSFVTLYSFGKLLQDQFQTSSAGLLSVAQKAS